MDKLDELLDLITRCRAVGVNPARVFVTLDEWAQMSAESGIPAHPIVRVDGVPVMLRDGSDDDDQA